MVDVSGKTTKAPSHKETLSEICVYIPFVKLSVFVPSWQVAMMFNLQPIKELFACLLTERHVTF